MKINQPNLSLTTHCSICGNVVAIRNEHAAKLINGRSIICDKCRRNDTPKQTKESYDDYLKSDHWLIFRKKALRHYGRKCHLCGREDGQIDIHHNTYERRGRELLSDVIPLCRDCHEAFHQWKKAQRVYE